jgi:hypothetical protein
MEVKMENIVTASPSKSFFVRMLTRDINLKDAILDLLDNCVDGILRQLRDTGKEELLKSDKPYDGYWAKITANPTKFSIEDNCGGIPKDLAINSAFRLGRSLEDLQRDEDIATIGMYGIGMKRALFKMGRHSKVISQHQGDIYSVEISPKWLDNDTDWRLLIDEVEKKLDKDGTSITVKELHPNMAAHFDLSGHDFLNELRMEIANLYALIIRKGFTVYLNEDKIDPISFQLLLPKDLDQTSAIYPYAYKSTIDNVNINLVVGFYRELASESELEDEQQIPRRTDNAGWTVICNDRIVLHHDRNQMTGWGISNVPKYHTQFISIAGIVQFSSNDSLRLPLNTTKRGLDTNSTLYWQVFKYMTEGLKKFTDFTNHWKGRESETTHYFKNMSRQSAPEIFEAIPDDKFRAVPKSSVGEKRLSPNLPRPPKEDSKQRISFVRLKSEVEILGQFFFEQPQSPPGDIGHSCFDLALKCAKEEV